MTARLVSLAAVPLVVVGLLAYAPEAVKWLFLGAAVAGVVWALVDRWRIRHLVQQELMERDSARKLHTIEHAHPRRANWPAIDTERSSPPVRSWE